MKTYAVFLVREAEDDLLGIHRYAERDRGATYADRLLARIGRACRKLDRFPNRGRNPPELERIGVFDFREVQLPPYRIIYEITGSEVHIHAVLDGRRDLQDLLVERVLR